MEKTYKTPIFYAMLAYWIGVAILLLISCTPQKRLTRLIKKHPELIQKDTIYLFDTVRVTVPGAKIDTFFRIEQALDTIYFDRDQLHAKVWIRSDTVFFSSKVDTVFKKITRKIPVVYDKIVYKRPRDWLRWSGFVIFGSLIFFFIEKIIRDSLSDYRKNKNK